MVVGVDVAAWPIIGSVCICMDIGIGIGMGIMIGMPVLPPMFALAGVATGSAKLDVGAAGD